MPLDLLRQLGLGDGDAVLHEHLGHVEVRAQLERDVEVHLPVVRALRRHVEHPLDAVDFLLDGRGHGVGHGLGVGAGIGRRDLHGRAARLRDTGRSATAMSATPPTITITIESTVAKIGRSMKK